MHTSSKSKAGFAAGLALLLIVGAASIYQTFVWEERVRWISGTHDVIENLDTLCRHAKAAVEHGRMFLNDKDQRRISETWEELDSARVRADRLSKLLEDSPSQQVYVGQLGRLIEREYDLFAKNAATGAREIANAINALETSRLVLEIDEAAREIRSEQNRLLEIRSQEQTRAGKRTRAFFSIASAASLLAIGLAFRRNNLDHQKRTLAESALASREEQYRQVVEGAGDIIYRTDAQGRFTFCNQTAWRALHLTTADVLGRSYLNLIRQDRRREAQRFYLRQFARQKKQTYYEFPITDGHGRERWVGQNVQLIVEHNRVVGFQAIARDITERKRTEAELDRTRDFLERIAATSPGILYVYDLDQKRNIFVNREVSDVLGYREEDTARSGQLLGIVICPEDLPLVQQHHNKLRKAPDGEVARIEYRARRADGRWLWLSSRDTPFERNPDGSVKQIVGIAQDITQRKTAEQQLEYQANFDALTGLSNRHHFFLRLNSALRRASIEGSMLSACVMDIDHFKKINDVHGHPAGDEVLQTVGEIIRTELRTSDIAGRLGGDEFCIVLVGADVHEASKAAERVRDRLTTLAFGIGTDAPFTVTATIGVAQASPECGSRELLEWADQALYEAKDGGRNKIAVRV